MSHVEVYELHGGKDSRPVKFISITCEDIITQGKRAFVDKDHDLLSATFEQILGARSEDIKRLAELEGKDFITKITEESNNLERYRMLIVHISSFGDLGHILSSKKERIAINDIIDIFRGSNCKQMVGKPKWFIVQACTIGHYEEPSETDIDAGEEEKNVLYLPAEADILTTISEVPGNVHWRTKDKGNNNSPFIEALCTAIKENKTLDITQVITRAINTVHQELEANAKEEYEQRGLLPYMTSTLRKSLNFTTVEAAI